MNQSPTLRGTLIQLRKYYQVFYTLNENKDDYSFLGWPFAGAYSDKQAGDYKILSIFYAAKDAHLPQANLEIIYNLVCRCFADNTEYELVKYMFALKKNGATRADPLALYASDPSTFAAIELAERIMRYKRFFTNRFNEDFPSTAVWIPNA